MNPLEKNATRPQKKKTVAVLTLQVENKMVHTYHLHNIVSL